MSRYGVPYKGSKNSIASWIVDQLPPADTFIDLFFGGGAVTHAALLSGKYEHFIVNDIDGRLPQFFLDCCYGKYTTETHPEWISREEFFKRKDTDAYIALIWSFGNNGKDYLYGKDLEEYKKAFHYACFKNDLSPFKDLGIKLHQCDKTDVYERYLDYSKQIGNLKHNALENFTRLQALESLQSLQSDYVVAMEKVNRQNIQNFIIYCDIPYNGTNCGKYDGFDSERFYEWARNQDNIFISEYSMPDDFIPYAWTEKTVLSAASTNAIKSKEMIFTNQRTWKNLNDTYKRKAELNFAKQITIEDLLING